MKLRFFASFGAAILLTSLGAAAQTATFDESFDDPILNERYRTLIHEVRCMKCQNQSIADSPIDVAADLRRQIHRMIADGASDAEIADYLTARYGDFILYRPPVKPVTWPLWGGPIVLLAIGGFVFARLVKKHSAQSIDEDGA